MESPDIDDVVNQITKDYGKANLELRPYQRAGIIWMIQTWQRGINDGGLLCDDMGLGKTCQVIHLLKYVHFVDENAKNPSLIIVPLSVYQNWQEEFKMWAPKLDLHPYYGSKDERPVLQEKIEKAFHAKNVVILCTPEMLNIDAEFFTSLSYSLFAFDEAQRIKNSESNLFKICFSLVRHSTILMTGTPVQNNMRELFALLSMASPLAFPLNDADAFICRYANVVGNVELQKNLQAEISRFMLRRVKSEVEPNLPSRGVIHLYVNLSDIQKKLYRQILARNIDALTGGIKNSRNNVQNALISLRKCVDHPYLFDGIEPEPFEAGEHLVTASGKLIVLDQLLKFLQPLGHRVLVFSQMTHMLDIIQDYFTFRNVHYERLDGSVRGEERFLAIRNFAKGSKGDRTPLVFLLSTKAGGVGLNLVSADTVVLFDSDMNPQNDLQAIARTHRIGQTKPVKVIRFVARHTVEENILRRQSAKICLSEAVVGGSGSSNSSLPGFEDQKNWLKEVLRVGLEKLFKDSDEVEQKVDFNSILGGTNDDGCWVTFDTEDVDADVQAKLAEKECADLTSDDLTAPLVEKLQQEAEQLRKEEKAKQTSTADGLDLLTERKRKTKKTEFLADEMLSEENERPRKKAPRIDPAIRRAQNLERLWKKLNYSSLSLPMATSPDLNVSARDEGDEDNENSRIRFVVGDVTKPQEQNLPGDADTSKNCIVCVWVDDGGSWGSGGVFTAVDNSLGEEPSRLYELASEATDLKLGDVHLCQNVANINSQNLSISVALMVCQHRKSSGEQRPIELQKVDEIFKRIRFFIDDQQSPNSFSVHLPRIGRGPLAAQWYGIERLVRKYFGRGHVVPYVYYFSRKSQPSSSESEKSENSSDSSKYLKTTGFFSNIEFCLKYLPNGCRALSHIEGVVKKFGGHLLNNPSDKSSCYIVVDRSDISDTDLNEIKRFPTAQCLHYSWVYACEKRQILVPPGQFSI